MKQKKVFFCTCRIPKFTTSLISLKLSIICKPAGIQVVFSFIPGMMMHVCIDCHTYFINSALQVTKRSGFLCLIFFTCPYMRNSSGGQVLSPLLQFIRAYQTLQWKLDQVPSHWKKKTPWITPLFFIILIKMLYFSILLQLVLEFILDFLYHHHAVQGQILKGYNFKF
jgi:hypothetical protein